MDFSHKIRVRRVVKTAADDLEALYPHSVLLYHLPPQQEITLQLFEDLAVERLKVLRILEQAGSKNHRYMSDEWKEGVIEELNLQKLKPYARLIQHGGRTGSGKKELDLVARQRDYVSHFILRMAYCKSEDLRRWFLTREMELFRLKFSYLETDDITKFLTQNQLKYVPLSDDEVSDIKDGLYESTVGNNLVLERMDFYKVPFTEVHDLVRARRCYLKDGFAYVSTNDFVSVVASKHEACIQEGLMRTLRMLPTIESDERVFEMIKELHSSYTGKDFAVGSSDKVPIECLDQLSKKSFPLCMRSAHEHLRIKHHHKYGGRGQYNLFLKGIGVTLEDALRFWQQEFTKIMDYDKFSKEYAYGIRHNYGKEGSMINYNPHSCVKIITESVGPQDTHGCPYKTMDPVGLKLRLTDNGLSQIHVHEVATLAAKGHPQLACARYFEVTMEHKLPEGINHPNQYFEMSQRIMAERTAKTGSGLKDVKRAADVVVPLKKEGKKGVAGFELGYDDDLWNAVDKAQSQADQTQQLELMEEDAFELSQLDEDELITQQYN